jgi:hypothetical protein
MYSSSRTIVRRNKWTINLRTTALYVFAWALVIGLFAFILRGPREAKGSVAHGTIQNARILVDHATETKWGNPLTWKAEYRLAYSVAGREFTMWADSGIRGESEADVQFALAQAHQTCSVQYNPQRPEVAVAKCR